MWIHTVRLDLSLKDLEGVKSSVILSLNLQTHQQNMICTNLFLFFSFVFQ